MNRQFFPRQYSGIILVGIAFFLCVVAAKAQLRYTVTDLGSLQGPDGFGFATGINNRGEVTANSITANGSGTVEASVWQRGKLTPLPTLGGLSSNANGINASGQVVGRADRKGSQVSGAVLWSNKGILDLGTLGGDNSEAIAINDKHQIVGDSEITPGSAILHSFFLAKGKMSDLNTLGGNDNIAFGLNQREQVTGQSDTTTVPDPFFKIPPYHTFLWEGGLLKDLGGILGGKFSYGNSINNRGEIVGSADLAGDQTAHAYIWRDEVVKDLGTLPEDGSSGAFAINNQGQAVGISGLPVVFAGFPPVSSFLCPCHAVLWENGNIVDLNAHIPANSTWTLFIATGINDRGQIVGQGLPSSDSNLRAFLLTPIDSSSTAADSEEATAASGSSSNRASSAVRVIRSRTGRITIERR